MYLQSNLALYATAIRWMENNKKDHIHFKEFNREHT